MVLKLHSMWCPYSPQVTDSRSPRPKTIVFKVDECFCCCWSGVTLCVSVSELKWIPTLVSLCLLPGSMVDHKGKKLVVVDWYLVHPPSDRPSVRQSVVHCVPADHKQKETKVFSNIHNNRAIRASERPFATLQWMISPRMSVDDDDSSRLTYEWELCKFYAPTFCAFLVYGCLPRKNLDFTLVISGINEIRIDR